MRKLLLLPFFILSLLTNAQIVNIPDANFKAKLIDVGVDTNADGDIQESEAFAISSLNLFNSNISDLTGIESFVNLINLSCSLNQIVTLDLNGLTELETLYCDRNQLTSLNVSDNVNLLELNCNNNQLTNLNLDGLTNLYYIECENNLLVNLDFSTNTSVIEIYCTNNQLIDLDLTQSLNLTDLYCGFNQLSNLDVTELIQLRRLWCFDNQLTNLDLSQNLNLKGLHCSNNDLVDLDVSQNTLLNEIYCENNQLTTLNLNLNTALFHCDINGNLNLTELFIKNGASESVDIGVNTPNLRYICADEDNIESMVIQLNTDGIYDVEVNSYCFFTTGGNYNVITGEVVFDGNENGCDESDIPNPYIRVNISDGTNNDFGVLNASGEYTFYTDSGNFTLEPSFENTHYFTITPTSANIQFSNNNNNTATQDFCITANGVHNDVEVIIVPITPAQPGFDATYQLAYRNKGNQTLSGEINFEYDDAVLDYISASIAPDSQSVSVLTWNYTDLLPFESRAFTVTLNVNAPTETPAVNIGDELDFVATINPIVGDETPLDNEFQLTQTVVGSYDPNDKTCLEGDIVEPSQIGEYLHFNINFENTGTAAATFVVVKDVIDETMFDMNTLQVMYASHEMMTQVAGNKIEFIFDNINLGPEEKGNVVFKIKTLDILNVGDSVTNDAEIFFDYNFPIVTNETNTTFQTLSVEENQLGDAITVYPNPTSGFLHINAQSVIDKIELYDVQGRLVLSQNSNQQELTVDTSSLTKGVYFVKIKTKNDQQIVNIIKE